MEKEEGNSISLRDILHVIGKKIWVALGASVAVALAVALLFMFVFNPMNAVSSMQFRLRYPMNDGEKYPDGSPFYYTVFTESDVLSGNSTYGAVNVGDMVKKNKLSVSTIVTSISDTETDTVYKLTVQNAAVPGRDGEKFIRAITSAVEGKIRQNADDVDYVIDESIFSNASFAEKLQLLNYQKNILTARYNEWINTYTATYKVNGKTLENYLSEVIVVYGDSVRASFEKSLKLYGLDSIDLNSFKNASGMVDYAAVRAQLADELILTLKMLKQLREYEQTEGGDSELSQLIATYAARSAVLQNQIGENYVNTADYSINSSAPAGTLNAENVEKFNDQIMAQYYALKTAAQTLKTVTTAIYEKETSIAFLSEKAETSGTTSVALIAVVVFVVSLIVSCIAAYSVGRKRQKTAQ